MFGYVTISKEQLTEDEYDIFCSYYCGVCKATGKRASQLSRMGLSYDITFLALVLESLSEVDPEIKMENCIVHPIKKRSCVKESGALDYAAEVGVILEYLKLADDLHDDKSVKAAAGMMLMHRGYKRSAKQNIQSHELIKKQLKRLSEYEKNGCDSIDETADAFAKILECLFAPEFIEDRKITRILSWMGYNLGRWIYILDAYNDMERDFKDKSYNPLLAGGETPEQVKTNRKQETELALTFTLENIASAFELLDFKRNESLIGKIIYTGLKQRQAFVLDGKSGECDAKLLKRRRI